MIYTSSIVITLSYHAHHLYLYPHGTLDARPKGCSRIGDHRIGVEYWYVRNNGDAISRWGWGTCGGRSRSRSRRRNDFNSSSLIVEHRQISVVIIIVVIVFICGSSIFAGCGSGIQINNRTPTHNNIT